MQLLRSTYRLLDRLYLRLPAGLRRRVTARQPSRRQRGVALLLVIVTTAILGATSADFAYNSQIELEAAVNSRDMLRAEYLARSGLQLGQLLTAVQASLATMLQQLPPEMRDAIVITDFAGFLAKAITGDGDERAGLGGLVGIDLKGVEGLGTPKGTSMDLTVTSEEGKFPINCGGGVNPKPVAQGNFYQLIYNMVRPTRYDRMFNIADRDGVMVTREDLPIHLIDWLDADVARYSPLGPASGSEETYDRGEDRYLPHNYDFDTTEEMMLVRGVSEDFWSTFGEMFTVYGSDDCKVLAGAIEQTSWPLVAAMIGASAIDKNAAFDPNTAVVAQQITGMLKTGLPALRMMGGQIPKCTTEARSCPKLPVDKTATPPPKTTPTTGNNSAGSGDAVAMLSDLICSPMLNNLPGMASSLAQMTGTTAPPKPTTSLRPIPLCPGMLGQFLREKATNGKNPRRFYRIDATGVVQRGANANKLTQTHIRGVWDTQRSISNPLCTNSSACFRGTWLYYRID